MAGIWGRGVRGPGAWAAAEMLTEPRPFLVFVEPLGARAALNPQGIGSEMSTLSIYLPSKIPLLPPLMNPAKGRWQEGDQCC